MEGKIVLEDGTVFVGQSFGAPGTVSGEVVFTTNMTGYQEVLTDPSYCGQIVTMTYPLIGNYGISHGFSQSAAPWVRGFVVHEACELLVCQNLTSIQQYLAENSIIGLTGVDTRALTKHLRSSGTMRGAITTDGEDEHALCDRARQFRIGGLVSMVTTRRPYRIIGDGPKVIVLDFGVKTGILRELSALDLDIAVLPSTAPLDLMLDMEPDGVFLSNGPGDPADLDTEVKTVAHLIGKVPIFGVCLGHQVIGLALGAQTYKMKYGHRGANHPVKDLRTGRTYVTSQNHGYAIAEESLTGTGLSVTHRNQNDGTVEGMVHEQLPVFSVQYHPEGSPGPHDSRYLFHQFIEMMRSVHAKGA
jgi:carbamoyl-phosphate synthase small subunit